MTEVCQTIPSVPSPSTPCHLLLKGESISVNRTWGEKTTTLTVEWMQGFNPELVVRNILGRELERVRLPDNPTLSIELAKTSLRAVPQFGANYALNAYEIEVT